MYQGEEINTNSLIQIKVKNNKTKTNGIEMIFNSKLQLPKQEQTLPAYFEKKKKKKTRPRNENKHFFEVGLTIRIQ